MVTVCPVPKRRLPQLAEVDIRALAERSEFVR
jgi:hypothetical protein